MEIKKIFSRSVALELMAAGNKVLYTESNRSKNWLVVFCFQETKDLLEQLTYITSKNK